MSAGVLLAAADDDVINSCDVSKWCLPPMAVLVVVGTFSFVASVLCGLPSSDVTFDNDFFAPSEILPDCTKSLLLAKFCAGVCSLRCIVDFFYSICII